MHYGLQFLRLPKLPHCHEDRPETVPRAVYSTGNSNFHPLHQTFRAFLCRPSSSTHHGSSACGSAANNGEIYHILYKVPPIATSLLLIVQHSLYIEYNSFPSDFLPIKPQYLRIVFHFTAATSFQNQFRSQLKWLIRCSICIN